MNSGSSPCAPRYLDVMLSPAPWPICDWLPLPMVSRAPPPSRSEIDVSVPVSLAIICSTGPPGANCTITKLISMMPSIVGMMRSSRLRR